MNNSASDGHTLRAQTVRKRRRTGGTRVVYPRGAQEQLGVSAPTRWRMERDGRLPPRDVYIGGKPVGWRPETLEAAQRGPGA